jgi:hypothetical protein
MKISDFYNDEYLESAFYQSFRSISKFVDGFKPSSRKVIYTVDKFNIKDKLKVSQLMSKTSETTQEKYCSEEKNITNQAKKLIGKNVVIKYDTRFGLYSTGKCKQSPINNIKEVDKKGE